MLLKQIKGNLFSSCAFYDGKTDLTIKYLKNRCFLKRFKKQLFQKDNLKTLLPEMSKLSIRQCYFK